MYVSVFIFVSLSENIDISENLTSFSKKNTYDELRGGEVKAT